MSSGITGGMCSVADNRLVKARPWNSTCQKFSAGEEIPAWKNQKSTWYFPGACGIGDLPPVTVLPHGVGDLDKARDVGTCQQAWEDVPRKLLARPLRARREALLVRLSHDPLQLRIDLLGRPRQTLAVLRHFKTRDGDTTAVGGLCKC